MFVAAVAPLAVAAAYLYGWRLAAAARLDSLESRHAALVQTEDFPAEMARAERRLKESAAELEAERAAPGPELKAVPPQGTALAERESAVLGVFAEAGLSVLRGEDAPERGLSSSAGEALTRAVGRDGWSAACRRYVIDGTYPAVKRALDVFAARRMAVVPGGVSMREGGRGRWTLEVWL